MKKVFKIFTGCFLSVAFAVSGAVGIILQKNAISQSSFVEDCPSQTPQEKPEYVQPPNENPAPSTNLSNNSSDNPQNEVDENATNYTASNILTNTAKGVRITPQTASSLTPFIPEATITMHVLVNGQVSGVSINEKSLNENQCKVYVRNGITNIDISYIFTGLENHTGMQSFVDIETVNPLKKENVYVQSFYVSKGADNFRELDFNLNHSNYNSQTHQLSMNGSFGNLAISADILSNMQFTPGQKLSVYFKQISGTVSNPNYSQFIFDLKKNGAIDWNDRLNAAFNLDGSSPETFTVTFNEISAIERNTLWFWFYVWDGTKTFDNCVYEIRLFTWGGSEDFKEIKFDIYNSYWNSATHQLSLNGNFGNLSISTEISNLQFTAGQKLAIYFKKISGTVSDTKNAQFIFDLKKNGAIDWNDRLGPSFNLDGSSAVCQTITFNQQTATERNALWFWLYVWDGSKTFDNCVYEIHLYTYK